MTEDKKPMSLAAKLARIGKEIGAVDKSGRNNEQKYNYIEYGVVAGRIRELFDTYGVIIIPSVEGYQADEITSKYGSRGYHYTLRMSFQLINGDDPEDRFSATWMGESADFGDKGVNKAETSGTKYFLMRLFNVSEKGEEEADKVTPEFASVTRVVSTAQIENAKDILQEAVSLDDLKTKFARLGDLRKHPEVIKFKDEMKAAFTQDTAGKVQDAKDQLAEHFNK